MKSLLRLLIKSQLKQNRFVSKTASGFTLLELLVAMIMTFLILTPLLTFVVDMLNNDRREQVKSNTEQEIQNALDYIAQDLSQAVYIYDNTGINNGDGNNTNPIANQLSNNPGTPILVFWKRQNRQNVLPVTGCTSNASNDCLNDTYVYSLVTYYLLQDNTAIWCQPSGGTCPARITRYEIQDGVLDPTKTPQTPPVATDYIQVPNDGFNQFNTRQTVAANNPLKSPQPQMNLWQLNNNANYNNAPLAPQVLVNYIDPTDISATPPPADECQKALGNPTYVDGTTAVPEAGLRISTNTYSFYACVDSSRTIARVFIRGNSLRRLQKNAVYNSNNSAYFPKASVQVQGLGQIGQ